MKKIALIKAFWVWAAFVLVSVNVQAQDTGDITGNVSDTAEAIIGAVVVVQGNNLLGAFSDVDGNFIIQKVKPGTYNIEISYFGYQTLIIKDIVVTAGGVTKIPDVKMQTDAVQVQQAVVISDKRTTNTETAVLQEVKNSEQVVSAISAEQISKSQDRDASQVMQRIPGVTIIDNRFVMVRGLAQRYNSVLLNNIYAPSSEVDEKAFSFDQVPSGLIDRILVYKSGAPELPGDFAGAAIKVFTKNIPDENQTTLTVSGSFRQGTTFQKFTKEDIGSKTDWLGFDDGTRALPSDFPKKNTFQSASSSESVEYAKMLNDNYATKTISALPDLRLNFNMARLGFLGERKFGSITSINYSNTRQSIDQDVRIWIEGKSLYKFKIDQQTARVGVIQNFSLNWSPRAKFDFKNMFNQIGSTEFSAMQGRDVILNPNDYRGYQYRYQSRTMYTGQLSGSHDSKNEKGNLKWVLGYAYTKVKLPDLRRILYFKDLDSTRYQARIPLTASNTTASRFYSDLSEHVMSGSLSYEQKINVKKDSDSSAITLRTGLYVEQKQRTFEARWFSYGQANVPTFDNDIYYLDYDQLLLKENLDPVTGLKLNEGTNPSDRYDASNLLLAPYVGASIPFLKRFNISGGLRVEYNRLQLQAKNESGADVVVDNPIVSPLPSANLSYNFTKKMLVRVAYFKSVNRQEFREIAPFQFYDFENKWDVKGNDSLKNANIDNIDVRWELYPTPAEFISFGVFYKSFQNAIERSILAATSRPIYSFANADKAYCYGVELEVRKSLAFLKAPVLKDLSFLLNASYIKSGVEFKDPVIAATQDPKRPMQGQSPYIINTGLYYFNEEAKLQVNLLYNVFGRRIFAVGGPDLPQPTTYEMPRNVIDLTMTKGFGKHWELRVGIQDLLNQKFKVVFDENFDSKTTENEGSFREFRRGTYYTLGLGYKF